MLLGKVATKTVGMANEAQEMAINDDMVCAAVMLKVCWILLYPPNKKQQPVTKSKLEKILPIMDDLTTSNWPAFNA